MGETKAYTADRIFTGDAWISQQAIIVKAGIIEDIIPLSELPGSIALETFPACIITPAFVDLQIYGAGGKLLAAYPQAASLFELSNHCLSGGTTHCLATLATNTKEVFFASIDAVRDYWSKGGKEVQGLHLEGPWINPAKRGAHIESLIRLPQLNDISELLKYGRGVIKMISLAPELCNKEMIAMILSEGIVISAGHSNATYEQAMNGFTQGITAVTHLYNAMSPLLHRAPGLVGAAMDHASVRASIIPDGHHVDYAAIRIAKRVMKERLFVITDAVTETRQGYYQHYRAGDKYEAGGILSGSALTMNKAIQNLVDHACVELGEAIRMCSLYPAEILGLHQKAGRIARGWHANILVMNSSLEVIKTFAHNA